MQIVIAAIKGFGSYKMYRYGGARQALDFRGTAHYLQKGDVFGLRPSSNGKHTRLVIEKLGPTKVFTIAPAVSNKLLKNSRPATKSGKSDPVGAAKPSAKKVKIPAAKVAAVSSSINVKKLVDLMFGRYAKGGRAWKDMHGDPFNQADSFLRPFGDWFRHPDGKDRDLLKNAAAIRAISKTKLVQGVLYRGLGTKDEHVVGNTFKLKSAGLSSWTSDLKTARMFADLNSEGGYGHVLRAEFKNAKNVAFADSVFKAALKDATEIKRIVSAMAMKFGKATRRDAVDFAESVVDLIESNFGSDREKETVMLPGVVPVTVIETWEGGE